MRPLTIFTFLLYFLPPALALSISEFPDLDGQCNIVTECKVEDTCDFTIQKDTRDCNKCLMPDKLTGACSVRGNDPVCEAAKAASNSLYANEYAVSISNCVLANKAKEAACNANVWQQKAVCESKQLEGSKTGFAGYLGRTDHNKCWGFTKQQLLALRDVGYFENEQVLSICLFNQFDVIPLPLEELAQQGGFVIGNVIYVADKSPKYLRFWVSKVELSVLFATFGIGTMERALDEDPELIWGLVEKRVSRVCGATQSVQSLVCDTLKL
ncbi:hypothetical protein OAG1_10970 [Agarivorans sp. OAG1]|uniref:hypothetical protein n=1 Tax=Agarivorans sp. OAG1 TaxID=3082387 RepID=UPI002B3011C9|nr:hypothetical protein OAG1_10970 [Agarivorans sp. OAG1]